MNKIIKKNILKTIFFIESDTKNNSLYITLLGLKISIKKNLSYYFFNKKNKIKTYQFNKINKKDKIIFIYRVDLIGDYVISKDILRILRQSKKLKGYKIVLLANKILLDFILDFDKIYIDEFIPFDTSSFGNRCYKKNICKTINKYNYEFSINYMSIRNIWSEFVTQHIKSGKKYGIKGLNINLPEEEKNNYDKYYDNLFDTICNYDTCSIDLLQQLQIIDKCEYKHHYLLDNNILSYFKINYPFRYIVIFPSASTPLKRMPFKKFMQISTFLYEKYNYKTLICGSEEDNDIFKNIQLDSFFINLCGKLKLSELPYLFKNAEFVFTNDTCAMWISNNVQTKTICFSNVITPDKNKFEIINFKSQKIYIYKNRTNIFVIFSDSVYNTSGTFTNSVMDLSLENININNVINLVDYILQEEISE